MNARTGVSIRPAISIQVGVSFGSEGNPALRLALLCMDATDDSKKLRKARVIVSEKLRAYFAEIKAGLDADSEDFFQRVMQQSEHLSHTPHRP